MKCSLFFSFILLLSSVGFSQSLSPQVTASAGDDFTVNDIQLSWTIGETIIETYTNVSNQLTQGFHQTNLIITSVNELEDGFQVNIYPNPTTDLLQIEWSENNHVKAWRLFDLSGKVLFKNEVYRHTMPVTLDLSAYAAGCYFLHLSHDGDKPVNIFKIVKLN